MQSKQIEKLRKQAKRAESRGDFNSAHHIALERLQEQQLAADEIPQKRRKVKQEAQDGKSDL